MIYFFVFITIIIADALTKKWAVLVLSKQGSIPVFKDVFHFTYVENRGAAFGMFQNGQAFFIIITLIVIAFILYYLIKNEKRSNLLDMGLSFLLSGAVGNLIDRVFRGFVVDFLDFCLIDFPVFNLADIFVCLGAGLVVIFIVFFDAKKG